MSSAIPASTETGNWPQFTSPETGVNSATLESLRFMTDGILQRALSHEEQLVPIAIFTYSIEDPNWRRYDQRYGLKIYSLAEGVWGFNTASDMHEDNSRRWVVYIDRGTWRGSHYDYKGAAYAHGGFESFGFPGEKQNIDTGSFDELIDEFYDNPYTTAAFQLFAGPSTPLSERLGPKLLHKPLEPSRGRWLRRLIDFKS